MPPSSRVISVACHRLLWVAVLKLLRVSPICSPSGSSKGSCHLLPSLPLTPLRSTGWSNIPSTWSTSAGPPPVRVRGICRIITRFLSACGDTGPQGWSALQAQNITTFIHQEAATTHGAGRKMPSVAVRSFLRFLVGCGELSPGLEAAAPTPRQWTHAPLPQRLTAEEVDRVLVASTGETPKALRNHALLLLLARLGLRAHEVASLCLDDLDWHEGRVLIRPGKTHQARVLPLVQDVGQAVAAYLHRGRPATTSRHVFLACRAPFQPLTDATAISRIATRALRRAGVTGHLRLGAHTFRHTAASQMVNRGASFKEVADVLGHRSLQTTGIYAKLDLDALVAVALPWMGETL